MERGGKEGGGIGGGRTTAVDSHFVPEGKKGRKAFAANQTTNPLLSLCAGKHGVSDAPATFIAPVAGVRVETFKDVSST